VTRWAGSATEEEKRGHATLAERYIGGKMQDAMPHLATVSSPSTIEEFTERAARWSRSWVALAACVGLGYLFSWLWAREEIANGLESWHSTTPAGGEEWFTWAGLWTAFVALPVFTFLWLRWVWKIAVWTAFLFGLSRRRLKLMAVHPDRTAGLGCLSDVQTSFSLILFGTGVLVSAFLAYQLTWESTDITDRTVWIPTLVYVFLAPGVFLAPLFLFTGALRRTEHAALVSLNRLTVEVAQTFQEQWFTDGDATGKEHAIVRARERTTGTVDPHGDPQIGEFLVSGPLQ